MGAAENPGVQRLWRGALRDNPGQWAGGPPKGVPESVSGGMAERCPPLQLNSESTFLGACVLQSGGTEGACPDLMSAALTHALDEYSILSVLTASSCS